MHLCDTATVFIPSLEIKKISLLIEYKKTL